ncbi:hypothetical protein CBS101457_005936 [Exobasidium rhododendri]|nr:hypothetical protein CBS101457_005936 [Exobasidium rhododendri]
MDRSKKYQADESLVRHATAETPNPVLWQVYEEKRQIQNGTLGQMTPQVQLDGQHDQPQQRYLQLSNLHQQHLIQQQQLQHQRHSAHDVKIPTTLNDGQQSDMASRADLLPLTPSQKGSTVTNEWDIRKVLHLYMHDYCLKQNYTNAAHAIAYDTSLRLDESVPLMGDAAEGLLIKWFSAFWSSFTNSSRPPPTLQSQSLSSQPLEKAKSKEKSAQQLSFGTVTNPVQILAKDSGLTSNAVPILNDTVGSTSQSPRSTTRGMAMVLEVEQSKKQASEQAHNVVPVTTNLSSQDAVAMMQKMGWGGRPMEALNGEEQSKLASAFVRSQAAQQQALQRMAQAHQSNASSNFNGVGEKNRGVNGIAFQQMPVTNQQISPISQSGPASPLPPKKKSPNAAGNQRKKRRSSTNTQGFLQSQQQQQHGNAQKGVLSASVLGPSPVLHTSRTPSSHFSPADATRNFEEQQQMARRLQAQSQDLIGRSSTSSSTTATTRSDAVVPPSPKGQMAQSEAVSQAKAQLNTQIAQMQAKLSRQGASSRNGGNTLNQSQISQLQVMQGKLLSQTNLKSAEIESVRQQQQNQQHYQYEASRQHQHQHHTGDMGPPPSPMSSTFLAPQQQQHQQQQHQHQHLHQNSNEIALGTPSTMIPLHSNPVTPAMTSTTSTSTSYSPLELRDASLNLSLQQQDSPIQFRDQIFYPTQQMTPPPHQSGMKTLPASMTDFSYGAQGRHSQVESVDLTLSPSNQNRFQPIVSTPNLDERQDYNSFGDINFDTLDWTTLATSL